MANPGSSSPALLETSSQANPGSVLPPRKRLREEGTEEDGPPRKQLTPWEPTSRWPDYPSKEDIARLSVSKFLGPFPRIFRADDHVTVQEVVLNAAASVRFLRQFQGETIDVDKLTIDRDGQLDWRPQENDFTQDFIKTISELEKRHGAQKIEEDIKQRIQTFIDEVQHDDIFMEAELVRELEELLVPLLKLDKIGTLEL
ncbi:hypothetical protein QBC42DRAFT_325934 [Cladorrhinum samala]|uniref:Uncharacterized protein n=1 Tax=Cladorrhinum samala TaxID=585594 RepID=A0AAV9HS59_9PEZI|nr:hypothetical protein QBC42DRAFT_325934 [Cladorrhinum samala]